MSSDWNPEEYDGLGQVVNETTPPLSFQIDCFGPKKNRMVPRSWFNKLLTKYLHPPKDYKIGGAGPEKWSSGIFERHYFPKEHWLEHKVGTLELKTFRKFQQARHIERQLSAGVKKDCISDSDYTTGGIKRSRRNGAITQTESNTNTSARSNDSIPPDESIGNISKKGKTLEVPSIGFLPPGPPAPCATLVPLVLNEDEILTPFDDHRILNLDTHNDTPEGLQSMNIETMDTPIITKERTINNNENSTKEKNGTRRSLNFPTPSSSNTSRFNQQSSLTTPSTPSLPAAAGTCDKSPPENNQPPYLQSPSCSSPALSDPSSPTPVGEQHCVDDGGRSKDGCCCGNMSKQLGTVEKLVLQLTNIVNRLSRSSSSLVNSRRTIECHRTFVTKSIGECPKDSVQQVVDLNSSLRDPKLAISMVFVISHLCKSAKTINTFANSAFAKLITANASQDLQWKSGDRGQDRRQGLSHLDSLLAVIGVCISGYAEERKQECSTARVIELIQNARKLAAQTHRQANNISDADAKLAAKNAKAISVPDENFADVTSNLEQRMSVLSDSVEKYVASN